LPTCCGNSIGRITPNGAVTEYPIPTDGSTPSGITSGPDGNLWFTEYDAGQIGRITPSGTITEYPLPSGDLAGPAGIVSGPGRSLWFTETSVNEIGRMTTSGHVTEIQVPSADSSPTGVTNGPGSSGTVWFTEQAGSNIACVGC
jgi:streptogramin lyase